MATEIMDFLIQVLCPTQQSAQACQQFVQQSSHQVMAPFGPLFYFLLFPSVFIIVFIWILMNRVIDHKGIGLLVGITVYIFIIISGWYSVVLPISEVWYIGVIILIGAWGFLKYFLGFREKGGTRGIGAPTRFWETVGEQAKKRVIFKFTDQKAFEETIKRVLINMEGIKEQLKSDPGAWRAHTGTIDRAEGLLKEYADRISILGVGVGGKGREYAERLEKILNEIKKMKK